LDIQQAVNTSKAFSLAFDRCQERRPLADGHYEMLMVPAITCLALAVEIGLKAIILRDGGTGRGHSLEKLVGMLSVNRRDTLLRAMGIEEATFAPAISLVSDAFVEWRYIYERDKAHVDLAFLSALNQAVQTLIAAPQG